MKNVHIKRCITSTPFLIFLNNYTAVLDIKCYFMKKKKKK